MNRPSKKIVAGKQNVTPLQVPVHTVGMTRNDDRRIDRYYCTVYTKTFRTVTVVNTTGTVIIIATTDAACVRSG